MRARLLLLVCSLAFPLTASASDYYVSRAGSDASAGTSTGAPWQTLGRVNSVVLQPGDRVLLRGGDTFSGRLSLDSADRGTASAPIAIGSYGSGRATIASGTVSGISVYNTSGITIANLNVLGANGTRAGSAFIPTSPATSG